MKKNLDFLLDFIAFLFVGGYLVLIFIAGTGNEFILFLKQNAIQFFKWFASLLALLALTFLLPKQIRGTVQLLIVLIIATSKKLTQSILKLTGV